MSDGFDKLGIEKWLCRRIASVGFGKPTQVQRSCIPPILEGRDCISCAKKDSGKNATIALPIIQRLAEDPYGVFAVIITPTRYGKARMYSGSETAYCYCYSWKAC
jgi:ATP-dependent RNA helicase DDX49/DBP8